MKTTACPALVVNIDCASPKLTRSDSTYKSGNSVQTNGATSVAETRDKLLKSGIEVATSSPAGFAALIKSDMVQSGAIIRAAGIRSD